MKKINILLSAMVLASAIPSYAAFCINCGTNLPSEANFCFSCGKPVSGAFEAAEPVQKTDTATVLKEKVYSEDSSSLSNYDSKVAKDNESLADYNFINRIEAYFTESTSNVAYRQCQELKRQNAANIQRMENEYMNYSIYRRKIHDLHMDKLQILENYLEARREADRGSDSARAKAKMNKELFKLDKINEAIDMLLTGGNTLTNINKVEDLQKRVKKTTADYVVTSSYLTLGNVRVRRNEPIWIEDVSGASARVHHMGTGAGDEPAVGYVSIYDLEKRTNWTSDGDFFYSVPTGSTVVLTQPVRPEPTVNVVVWDGIYPYRRWHHFPDWGPPPPPAPSKPHHHVSPAPPPSAPAPGPGPAPAPNRGGVKAPNSKPMYKK